MATTFYWHDYETFGTDARRDAPTQFAGVRTDAQLQEIGEPLMFFCRPPLDALPHPQACLITGVTPQVCAQRGVSEAEFARRILAELAEPGTVGAGYNSLKFDDEVTRHLLWRNLLDPYAREWQNGCGRWDLLLAVRCVYALRPEGLEWPRGDDGRHSLKLERLTQANGLSHESAHDALSDVRATVALARLILQRQPRLWAYCQKMRDKAAVEEEIGAVLGHRRRPFLHVSGMVPQERGHLALMWPLAPHPTQSNEILAWDLAEDPLELLDLDLDTIGLRMFTRRDELPEGVKRLPIKSIHLKQSPVVISALNTLRPERAQSIGLDLAQQLQRAEQALARAEAFDAINWRAVHDRPRPQEPRDAELSLYGGAFISREDRRTLDAMPAMDPQALAQWMPHFQDARLDDLLLRYRARNWPQSLTVEEQAQWQAHRSARLIEGRSGFRTLQAFQDEIDRLYEAADERQQALLEALVDWAETIAP